MQLGSGKESFFSDTLPRSESVGQPLMEDVLTWLLGDETIFAGEDFLHGAFEDHSCWVVVVALE